MLDLRLEYIGDGKFRTLTRTDFDACHEEFATGDKVRAKLTHMRSVRQNDAFHAMIQNAFDNQRAGPRFPTWKHLKSWLLIKADWCDVKTFDPRAITPEVAATLRMIFDTVDFTTDGRKIYMKVARSVRFGAGGASSEEFGKLFNRVEAIICTEIVPGLSPRDLRRESEKAA